MHRRLQTFGIPRDDVVPLLHEFVDSVQSGHLSNKDAFEKYNLSRFSEPFPTAQKSEHIDRIFTNVFYTWACDPQIQPSLEKIVPSSTLSGMQRIQEAADLTYPSESFILARTMRRKVIMHVGPTNSGKTHQALRALAAAKSGLYAGPLRLLAHEVWERLNKGQIVPLGVDPEPDTTSAPSGSLDLLDESEKVAPTVRKDGNPKYARPCNLLTGEEQKIVSPEARLLSATVEMVHYKAKYDVAVVDEIQMAADPQRGGAWTNAVLGLCAMELHLCGEERAVPIIKEMLKETGDELIVNRYERLTPLVVEEESLEGRLDRVRKGDCIVAFSRGGIFSLKRQVEKVTGLRCAVAYGRLPPEVRSEQAALFNNPESGYDVMIGSDALGMGLNLYVFHCVILYRIVQLHSRKIKRIIFQAVRKWDGRIERLLSTSQMKQIAGRAGRYDEHGDRTSAGFATTLYPNDLPILREALATPLESIQVVYVTATLDGLVNVAQALPPRSTTAAIHQVHSYIARMRPIYRFEDMARFAERCELIDTSAGELTLEDRNLFIKSPVSWRDPLCVQIAAEFMRMYKHSMRVVLVQALGGSELLETLRRTEKFMSLNRPLVSSSSVLPLLETFHKVLVLYMWLSIRNSVVFCDHEQAAALKGRVEKALDWCLVNLPWRPKSHYNTGRKNKVPPPNMRAEFGRPGRTAAVG